MEQPAKGRPTKKPTQAVVNDADEERRLFFESLKSSRVTWLLIIQFREVDKKLSQKRTSSSLENQMIKLVVSHCLFPSSMM